MTKKKKLPNYTDIMVGGFLINDEVIRPKDNRIGIIKGFSFTKNHASATVYFETDFVSRVYPINVLRLRIKE